MDREKAIQILSTRDKYGVLCGYTSGVTEALDMAIEALSTEIVQIIQCKDCRWYEDPRKKIFENCVRGGRIIPMKPTDYCSYGKPKDGDAK